MSKAFDQDYKGQRVKIAYPGDDSVYGTGAAYITFNEAGQVQTARSATDAEVQWWMSLQQSECLQRSIEDLTERVFQLLQRAF